MTKGTLSNAGERPFFMHFPAISALSVRLALVAHEEHGDGARPAVRGDDRADVADANFARNMREARPHGGFRLFSLDWAVRMADEALARVVHAVLNVRFHGAQRRR